MTDIKSIDLSKTDLALYKQQLADCVVLTHDKKLYLAHRPETWRRHPGSVHIFGGHVEQGETAIQAVIRELNEETGARINKDDLLFIGAVTEGWTNHTEIVHVYFWHDKDHTMTGCYEGEPLYFDTAEEAIAHPKIMDYAKWALEACQKRGLI